MVAVHFQDDLRRVLDEEGRLLKGANAPKIADEDLLRIFEYMLIVVKPGIVLISLMNKSPDGASRKSTRANPARSRARTQPPADDTPPRRPASRRAAYSGPTVVLVTTRTSRAVTWLATRAASSSRPAPITIG